MKLQTVKDLAKYATSTIKKKSQTSKEVPYSNEESSSPSPQIKQPFHSFYGNITRDVNNRDVFKYYQIVRILGEGSMGTVSCVRKKRSFSKRITTRSSSQFSKVRNSSVFSCLRSVTSAPLSSDGIDLYALKSIHKDLVTPEFMEELRNEIDILKTLDHPNIVKAYDVFDSNKETIYIVMELCSGGDLYMRNPYSEKQACKIVLQITSAIAYMHENGVVHRDLKFENIMFENSSPNAQIKVIDFGLSKKCSMPGEHMTEGVGTIYTIAPQVLEGIYTYQADMWSVGVIAYMLLSSVKPFYHKKRRHVIQKIMNADYNYNSIVWARISKEAKDFISSLLVFDPDKRMTAEQALESPWLIKASKSYASNIKNKTDEDKMMQDIGQTLLKYKDCTSLKKMALMVIAHKSSTKDIVKLRDVFFQYDTSGDGCISRTEFQNAMSNFHYTNEEVDDMFHSIDMDNNGVIFYTEFLASTLEALGHIEEEKLIEAFNQMDLDESGFISKLNLKTILGTDYTPEKVEILMSQVDENNDGRISYEEFMNSFRTNKREEIDSVFHKAVVVGDDLSSSSLSSSSSSDNDDHHISNNVSGPKNYGSSMVRSMKRVLSGESLKVMLK